MSTVLIQPAPLTLPSPADVYRITVDQYDQMVQLGTIGEHARVELLGGILVRKMPKNPDHTWAVESLKSLLDAGLPAGWHARQEQPVRIPDYDEPEADLVAHFGPDESASIDLGDLPALRIPVADLLPPPPGQ